MTYNCILHDSKGNFFKPIEIKFDPHMRVGLFTFDDDLKDFLAGSKEFFCICNDDDGCHIKRILYINSISFKSNVATFSYKNLELDISNIPFLYDLKEFPKELSVAAILGEVEKIVNQNNELSFSKFLQNLQLLDIYPVILLISIYMSLYEDGKDVDILELCFLLKEIIYSSS